MGQFHLDNWLELAHQAYKELPHETVVWAHYLKLAGWLLSILLNWPV